MDVTHGEHAATTASGGAPGPGGRTVRDATFDVLRRLRLTTMFSNPGSTEVPFLAGMPDDLEFVLGLHEGAVVGMAAGFALARSRSRAGAAALDARASGNAVAALATARQNRAPLVVLVGQQDRRHLAQDPFLAGSLDGLAGDYPVWRETPARAADVPGAIVRAYWEASTGARPGGRRRPDGRLGRAGAGGVGGRRAAARCCARPAWRMTLSMTLPRSWTTRRGVALVAGASAEWSSLIALAERLGCPVWAEPFGGAAGFPQDHRQFAGHLPARRARVREALRDYDMVLVVGTGALRQYPYDNGPLFEPGTTVAVVTADPAEAHRSVGRGRRARRRPAAVCAALAAAVAPRGVRRTAAAGRSLPRGAARAGRRRAADARARAERAGRAAAAGRRRGRGDAVVAAGAARAAADRRAGRVHLGDGAAGVRAAVRDRRAAGAAGPRGDRGRGRRGVALPDHVLVVGRRVPGRRGVPGVVERRLRDHGSAGRAHRRRRRAVAGVGQRSTSAGWRARKGSKRSGSPSTPTCWRGSTT